MFVALISIPQLSCASNSKHVEPSNYNELMKFAYANCLFQYLKSENIDTTDIRHISGGIVEKSSTPINIFQKISIIISNYNPNIETKNDINIKLNKCFHLENSKELNKIISNKNANK